MPCGSKIRSKSLYLLRFSRYSHFFVFPLKSKMAAKSGENWNFSPLDKVLLYYPAGQKLAQNRCISYSFRDFHTFSFSAKIQDGRQKWRNWNFSPWHRILLYYPVGKKFARNRSLMVFEIFTFFRFPLKSKMAAKSGENWNFSPLHRILLYYPLGQKFAWNRSISYGFRDIYTFPFFTKIQDGRQKWRKLKFFAFA